jgi:oligopeptide transport system substrate-binding protein
MRTRAIFLSFFALAAAASCARRETPVAAGIRTQTLHVGNGVEPQELDPHTTTGAPEFLIQKALFEGLILPDPVTGQPTIPGVAKSWDVSDDLLTYTFHLRPEARWSDGRPVVAADYVRSAQRTLAPKLGAEAADDFFEIAGARPYFEGRERDFSRVGVRALDAHTLQYVLAEPTPVFLHRAMGRLGMPLPIDVIARHGGLEKRATPWTRPANFVGNGPFVLKEWSPNKVLVVEKSPTYWDREAVKLQRICFHPVVNAGTEEKMFRAGQLHKTFSLPITRVDVWRRDNPAALRLEPEMRNRFMVVNCTRAPFNDVRVRRALALAIDRDQLVRALGGRPVARSFAAPNGNDFEAVAQFQDDVAAARALLAEAGYPGGKGFRRIEVLVPNRGHAPLTVEILQEMWRRNLGIEAVFNQQEWSVYIDSENNGQYDVCYDGWAVTHPHFHFDLNRTGCPKSRYLWSNAEYDDLLRQAARAPNTAARNAVYLQMEAILAREMPAIPLHFEVQTHLMHPAVRGWHANWPNERPWKAVSLEGTL